MGSPNAAMPTDLNLIPAGTPPPGVNSYPLFKGESLATTTLVLFCILVPIATLAVILRLLASHKVRGNGIRGIGWADGRFRMLIQPSSTAMADRTYTVCSVGALIFAIGQESIILSCELHIFIFWPVRLLTSCSAQNPTSWMGHLCCNTDN